MTSFLVPKVEIRADALLQFEDFTNSLGMPTAPPEPTFAQQRAEAFDVQGQLDRAAAAPPQPPPLFAAQGPVDTAPAAARTSPLPGPVVPAEPYTPPPSAVPRSLPATSYVERARQAALNAGIDPETFVRQINQESGFAEDVITGRRRSSAGAVGIAQFMPATAAGMGIDPLNPEQALNGAASLMRSYLDRYGGDWKKALAAYNAGPGAVQKYGGVPPFKETQQYIETVLGGGGEETPTFASQDPSKAALLGTARKEIGKRYAGPIIGEPDSYRWGSVGWDCSSFVSGVYKQFGINLTPFTDAIANQAQKISARDARPGDIVMFRYDDPSQPGVRYPHTGLLAEGGRIVDAAYGRGVTERAMPNLGEVEYYRPKGVSLRAQTGVPEAAHAAAQSPEIQQTAANPLDAFNSFVNSMGNPLDAIGRAKDDVVEAAGQVKKDAVSQFSSFVDGLGNPWERASEVVGRAAESAGESLLVNSAVNRAGTDAIGTAGVAANEEAARQRKEATPFLPSALTYDPSTIVSAGLERAGVPGHKDAGFEAGPIQVGPREMLGFAADMAIPIGPAARGGRALAREVGGAVGEAGSRVLGALDEISPPGIAHAAGKTGARWIAEPDPAGRPTVVRIVDTTGKEEPYLFLKSEADKELAEMNHGLGAIPKQPGATPAGRELSELTYEEIMSLPDVGDVPAGAGAVARAIDEIAPKATAVEQAETMENLFIGGMANKANQGFGAVNSKLAADPAFKAVDSMYRAPAAADTGLAQMGQAQRAFTRMTTDRLIDLKYFQEQAAKTLKRPLSADEMAYELARLEPAAAAQVRIQEGLRPAIQAVGDDYDLLTQYITHTHNVDVAKAVNNPARRFSGGITAADSQRVLDTMRDTLPAGTLQKIEAAADDVWRFGTELLERKRDSGIISEDLFSFLKQRYPHYVPTKILDYLDESAAAGGRGRKLGLSDAGLKRLSEEGTDKAREDPIASLVRQAYDTERAVAKNDAVRAFVRLRDAHPEGDLIREVAFDAPVGRDFEKIHAFIDGDRKTFALPQHLAAAVKMEQQAMIPGLSTVMNVVRMGMTARNPVFLASNALMDAVTFATRSAIREGGPQHLPRVLKELAQAYADAFKGLHSGTYSGDSARFLKGGGGQFGFFRGTQTDAAQVARDLRRTNGFEIKSLGDANRLLGQLLTAKPIEEIGARIELAPRVAAMRLAEKRGANALQAVIDGRTVTIDFQQGGTVSKFINQFIPFFNVATQSTAQPFRAWKENPKAFLSTVGAMTVGPTAIAEAWNRSDEQRAKDYDDVPQYLKDSGIVFMLPVPPNQDAQGDRRPQYLYIPTREFSPFVVAAREAMGRVMGQESREWGELLFGVLDTISPITDAGGLLPVGASTVAQLATNRDLFRGRAVVSRYTDEQASETAKAIANIMQEARRATGRGDEKVSPGAVEFAVRDTLGGGGGAILAAGDLAMGKTPKGTGIQATPGVGGLVGRFVKDTGGEIGRRARDETLSSESIRLLRENGVEMNVTPVRDSVNQIPLLRSEQARYQELANKYVEQAVRQAVKSSDWKNLNPTGRESRVRNFVDAAKDRAGLEVLNTLPSDVKRKRLDAERAASAA